ncbi:inositol monophosphatase family protein [Rhodovibrionaceae bacterium A322]
MSGLPLDAWLSRANKIASDASRLPMRYFKQSLAIERKGDESPVTQADRETEQFIRAELQQAFPEHGLLGEEFGTIGEDRRFLWVVDPIDGTKSFISGTPLFSTLIALVDQQENETLLGSVTFPGLGEQYSAVRGQGAYFDLQKIQVRAGCALKDAMVYVNEGDKLLREEESKLKRLNADCSILRFSYDAYSYAVLASGQVDALIDYDLQPYDYLAVAPLVEEAGGVITDWQGQPLTLKSDGRVVAASSPQLHAELLELFA